MIRSQQFWFGLAFLSLSLVMALFLFGEDPEAARETLRKAGFTEVETLGYVHWGCGEGDTRKTRFRAKNVRGESIEGVVCCGTQGCGKNCTIRF